MKKFVSLLAIFLALITLLAPATWAFELYASNAPETDGTENSIESLDFGYEHSTRAHVSPSDLLSALTVGQHELSDTEKNYLDGYFEHYLTYSDTLPAELVTLSENGEKITLTAEVSSYTAANGQKVTFVPAYAVIGGARQELTVTDGKYTATLTKGSEESLRVYYNGALNIPAVVANRLLNFTYNEANNAIASAEYLAEYNAALNEYKAYVAAYEKYEADLADYTSYVEAKKIYDEAILLYEQNQRDLQAYYEKLSAYNEYTTVYNQYLVDMENYKSDYAVYEKSQEGYRAYVGNLSKIRTALIPMESLFFDPEGVRCLYQALQNEELVSMFEKYQSILINNFGVKESDIKYMRQYSDELNALLREYAAKREISEEEAFNFYKANYKRITSLFNGLYDKMKIVLTPTVYNLVCGKLELEYGKELGEYKKWRVKNVLCHIYLICLCLDDTRAADSTWKFYSNDGDPFTYYFSDLLAQELIITDSGASDPSELSWMAPVELGEAPVMPTRPEVVEKPLEPIEMAKPTKPAEVKEPARPAKADEPSLPKDFDNDLLLRTNDIITLLGDKTSPLTKREEFTSDPVYETEAFAEVSLSKGARVTLYGRDGKIDSCLSDISLIPESLEGFSDSRLNYAFYGWSLSPVEYIPIPDTPTYPISVYPLWDAAPRKYTITFSFDGRITEKQIAAGELPSYEDINTKKESDSLYDYNHRGFDFALRRVDRDFTYVAVYLATDRIFDVTFELGNKTVKEHYVRGSTIQGYPTPPSSYISGTALYRFKAWDKPLETVTSDTVYRAIFEETLLADAESGELTLTDGASSYTLSGKGSVFTISELLSLSGRNQKDVTLRFEDYDTELQISLSGISSLLSLKAKNVIIHYEGESGRGIGYTFTDANGNILAPSGKFRMRIPHSYDTNGSISIRASYRNGLFSDSIPCSVLDGAVEFSPTSGSLSAGAYYTPVRKITINVISGEKGNAFTDATVFSEGEIATLNIYPDSGYYCNSLILINSITGEETAIEPSDSFTVPSYNASLRVDFAPVEYTVSFEYNGNVIEQKYKFGETPTPPEIPLSFTEDGYFYTFIGWATPITIVMGNAVYTAKYFSVPENERAIDTSNAIAAIITKYVIPAAIVLLVVIAATITLIILKKKGIIFKKKKESDKNG